MILTITALTDPKKVPNAKIRIQIQAVKDNVNGGPNDDGGQIPQITLGGTGGEYLGKYWPSEKGKLKANQCWNYDIDTVEPVELKTLDLRMEYYGAGNKYRLWPMLFVLRACPGHQMTPCPTTIPEQEPSRGPIHGQGFLEDYAKNKDLCHWGVSFGGGSISLSKREDPANVFGNETHMTSSDGAIALCDSATSWGPSMLSLEEGIFCDMSTKTKIPLCTDDNQKGCVKYNRQGGSSNRGGTLRAAPTTATRTLQAFQLSDLSRTVIGDGKQF
ncbi:hypothetical protein EC957_011056 [Mortierella hygrophila]|uniref:Uncharacterized protein n=1 Tax=Mortierella hygrophila TaxID=979708 RepID=A0A9P6K414_9FUNG|nr:hypothetical protein EC957_011056 [Mortierella hygrophila]